ncbi:hydroxysqualene dehydroxylase HpnE [Polaromonas naphthalenivorans]|uniref:UDP-galactopyranose mutase n=1 Tax=Polaromonas naphthalenivorans (strain CJ2) TaxID=365044 RepID=A1VRI6_POLNA|nr:hydroxysqualene dehydroxylase HpnE [Polaromonas naphthalenivorans]ABM38264.1 UDP-galactopyranose mutase [Polaromonas naphthalenivorans CJ2]
MKVAIVGAGWAGCAAAVEATRLGHHITVFEASRTAGGRARRVMASVAGLPVALDNGQHILIGAYAETLRLMKELGADESASFLRLPLAMQFPDGSGLKLPDWPAPLDAFAGILTAGGWSWADKLSLLKVALGWRLGGFACQPGQSVSDLCRGLTPGAMASLIEPLCVSALNTPAERASGQVFLRVMRDALFAQGGGSNLLLPRVDLNALLPDAALAWLAAHGGLPRLGVRVQSIAPAGAGWTVDGEAFDRVVLACPPNEAARLAQGSGLAGDALAGWIGQARGLRHEALTTVYLHASEARLRQPMLALPSSPAEPAQFVFDRGQLGGPAGLLAFVISASTGDGATLTRQVLAQAARQLGLIDLRPVQTIVEKRATFACTPGLQRPAARIAEGLLACGDYIAGPYPATLEGAVRSGLEAAAQLH